jgi:hypothetical protein
MKFIILIEGLGTINSEGIIIKKNPVVNIGGTQILWCFLKICSFFRNDNLVFCYGYQIY